MQSTTVATETTCSYHREHPTAPGQFVHCPGCRAGERIPYRPGLWWGPTVGELIDLLAA